MSGQPTPYLGSKISLISKSEIRYEGILYTVDTKESTIALAKVKSFGTEDRPTAQPIAARDEVFEYIIFKATDIKDLMVCETPKPMQQMPSGLPYDPAIVSVSNAQPPKQSQNNAPSGSTSRSETPANPPNPSQPHQREAKAPGYGRPPQQHGGRGGFAPRGPAPHNYRNALLSSNFPRPPMPPRGYPSPAPPPGYQAPRGYGGNVRGGRGGAQPPGKAIKFDSEYDFEAANANFEETLKKLKEETGKLKVADDKEEAEVVEEEEEEVPSDPHFYDSKKSFFDNISCESKEKEEGANRGRRGVSWKKERDTNLETFGQSAVRSYNYRRGGRGGGYSGPTRGGQRGGYQRY